MIRLTFLTAMLLAGPSLAEDGRRIVTLGGSVTEIAMALGAGESLVARDTTSNWPEGVLDLPDVGYIRALSPEGVLSVAPDLIIAEGDAGPVEAVDVLKAAGVPFLLMPEAATADALPAKILAVGDALGLPEEAKALAAEVQAGLDEATTRADGVTVKKRALFILSLQGGRVMAGGEGTEAAGIITLSGAENAGTGFQGYKQMTDEAVIAAAPEVILMMDREDDLSISDADTLAHPALAETPAGKTGQIIRMDGMLMLGFGPRTPDAARQLFDAIYPAGTSG
jgi:iron complex transport system substrate-binding protein